MKKNKPQTLKKTCNLCNENFHAINKYILFCYRCRKTNPNFLNDNSWLPKIDLMLWRLEEIDDLMKEDDRRVA